MARRALIGAACVGALLAPSGASGQTSPSPSSLTAPAPTTTAPAITAAEAGPGAIVDGADRVELAQGLAEATQETGVCFGYALNVYGAVPGTSSEQASNGGPDAAPGSGSACPKGVVSARISLTYTSESSEREDSASIALSSTVPGLSTATVRQRLDDLGLLREKDFLGNDDDLAVRNLAAALPLTLNDAVPGDEPAAATSAPNGDRLTGSPGSDWVRAHLVTVLVGGTLLLVGVGVALAGWTGRRRAAGPRRPSRDATS